jgi:hypothetical protein
MRVIALAVATIAIIVVGLSIRPTPHATASPPEAARALMDPAGMHTTVGAKSLPRSRWWRATLPPAVERPSGESACEPVFGKPEVAIHENAAQRA